MLNVSSFGYTTDIYTIIHFIPHACQHITVNQSHNSGDTAASWRQTTAALRAGFL
jgi:hypothetical protein